MEGVFFELIEQNHFLGVEVGYNSIASWNLSVYDRQIDGFNDGSTIVKIEESDRNLLFSNAYVKLCEYLSEANGGY